MGRKGIYFLIVPFAVVLTVVVLVKMFYKSFSIPTPAMEGTILMGDHVLCRLNGEIKKGEVTIFYWPGDKTIPYIKRMVGGPGDTLLILNKEVYLDGKPSEIPLELHYHYKIYTENRFPDRIFRKYGIPNFVSSRGDFTKPHSLLEEGKKGYIVDISPVIAETILRDGPADSIKIMDYSTDGYPVSFFPYTKESYDWNIDNYGPLWIPQKGATIQLDSTLVSTYETTIRDFEGWKTVVAKGDRLVIDGKVVTEYTFGKDYYFMMGDNRHNSADSRFWGFVPEDYIIGKVDLVWFSIDEEQSLLNKIRWKRLFYSVR